MGTQAFGFYANPNNSTAFVRADRNFSSGSLSNGQTFSFKWGVNYDSGSGGNKGFNLYSGGTGGAQLVNINNGGSAAITLNGTDVGFGYGTAAMTWTFTQLSPNVLRITANDRDGTGSFSTNVVVAGRVDSLRIYASAMQAGDAAQPYFNDFTVTAASASDADTDNLPDWWEIGFFGNTTSQADTGDADNDNLSNLAEYNAGTNPNLADTDGDGVNDGAEVTAGRNPLKYNFPLVTVAGTFQNPAWVAEPSPTADPKNVLSPVSGDEFGRSLAFRFTAPANHLGKFTDGQAFTSTNNRVEWGNSGTPGQLQRGGGDLSFPVTASGVWIFFMNTDTLNYSFSRLTTNGLTYAQWAAQYGLLAGSGAANSDNDLLTNEQEFAVNTDPFNGDTDGDGLFDDEEVVGVYTDVLMEDLFTPSARAPFLNGVLLNPLSADTDGDGLPDLFEVRYGLDPTDNGAKAAYANYTGLTIATTGANPNGASGDPDGDNFSNLEELNSNSSPIDAASRPASRLLTFQVDLRQEIARTNNIFNPTNNGVEVRGSFNGWAGGTTLTNSPTNGVYTGAVLVKGSSNAPINYKFYGTLTNGTAPIALEYEPNEDRFYTLKGDQVNDTLPLAVFGDNISTRQVNFSVNMSVQQALGRFSPGTDKVYLVGDVVGSWDPGVEMGQVGSTPVYTLTRAVTGPAGITLNYKFRIGNSLGYEGDLNPNDTDSNSPRTLTLGARDVAQTVSEAYFNDVSVLPANRTVAFAVNMNVQTNTNKISFNPATHTVEVRLFGPDATFRLTNNGSGIFSGSFPLPGVQGTTNNYKYVALVGSNVVFERVDVPRNNEFANRTFVLGPTNSPQTVHSVASPPPALFSNDDGIGPVITVTGDNPLNLANGTSYSEPGATAFDAIDGSVTATPSGSVNSSVAGSYTITYTASDAAGNTSTATRTVVVAAPSGSSFSGWLGSNAPSAELLRQYAFGATSPSNVVNRSNLPVGGISGSNLTLTYYVRGGATNANLVVPQVHTNLVESNAWVAVDSNNITPLGTNTVDGVQVIQKRASVPMDGSRKFLRLKIAE